MKSTSPTFSITFNNPPVHPTITTTLKKHPPAPKKQPTPSFSITLNNPVGETEDQKPYLQGCPAEVLRQPKPGDAT